MYRLTTTKRIAGVSLSVPMVTCESKPTALKKMSAAIKDAENELNADEITLIGGQIDITLEECAHMIGGVSDVIARATVKREKKSQKAEIIKNGL